MVDDVEFRELNSNDVNEVIELHNTTYGDNRTPNQWDWEYKSHYSELYVFTIAYNEKRIVGTQGFIPIYINHKGKRYLSGKSENSILSKEYRGKSTFKDLYDYALLLCKDREMQYIWGFTSAVDVWREKLGFIVFEDIIFQGVLILNNRDSNKDILDSNRNIVRKIGRTIINSVRFFRYKSSLMRIMKYQNPTLRIEGKMKNKDNIKQLYQHLRDRHHDLIHIEQDEKYISWRILSNPNNRYHTFFAYEGEDLKGYCYISIKDKTAHLTDFTFETLDTGTYLLSTILNFMREKKITYLKYMGNVTNPLVKLNYKLLEQCGFKKGKDSMCFVLKDLTAYNNLSSDISKWYVYGLWTEGFRDY